MVEVTFNFSFANGVYPCGRHEVWVLYSTNYNGGGFSGWKILANVDGTRVNVPATATLRLNSGYGIKFKYNYLVNGASVTCSEISPGVLFNADKTVDVTLARTSGTLCYNPPEVPPEYNPDTTWQGTCEVICRRNT